MQKSFLLRIDKLKYFPIDLLYKNKLQISLFFFFNLVHFQKLIAANIGSHFPQFLNLLIKHA